MADETPTGRQRPTDSQPDPQDRLEELIAHSIDAPLVAAVLELQSAADAADALERLDEEDVRGVLGEMDDQAAADVLAELESNLVASILDDLVGEDRHEPLGRMLSLLAPDDAVALLRTLDDEDRTRVLATIDGGQAGMLRELVGHPQGTAAGMMTTRHVALPMGSTVREAVEIIRTADVHEDSQFLPVIDSSGRLSGLVGLRSLLVEPSGTRLEDFMDTTVHAVRAETDDEDVARTFQKYDHTMLPVVDSERRLLGIVTVDDVIDLIQSEQTEDVQRSVGAGAGESIYSGLTEKMAGRLPWLFISVLMMIPASMVVLRFDGLIEQIAFLAVLMPMVAALAGNAGHQSLAVTLRGLALDELPEERIPGLLLRELGSGLVTGGLLGGVLVLLVWLTSMVVDGPSLGLGIVMGLALVVSMSVGTLTGAVVPLLLRRFGADPAQGSCIVLIMITDAVAFGSLLGFTWLGLSWLLPGAGGASVQ
ncbi:MAG TPA: magnesium transporter [Phycisphaerales bacterium]|nr:magnesium transporter [Phycisphaerales bacterium]